MKRAIEIIALTRRSRGWLAVALVVSAGLAAAQDPQQAPQPAPVPELMTYQGLVYLEDGSTDITGTYDMAFYLYHEAVGGTVLWAEGIDNVQVSRGVFSVLLGSGAAIAPNPHGAISDVFTSDAVYIEIRVDGDNPLRIRQRFTATPYALAAQHAVTAVHGVPPGTVMPFAGSIVPYGWLLCNGASYTETEFPDLFAAIGTLWGGGAGAFNVPNMGGRIPAGVDGFHPLTLRRGAEQHVLTTNEIPSHTHTYSDGAWSSNLSITGLDTSVVDNDTTSTTRTSGSAGSNSPHNNMQPVAVVNYIIKW